MYKEQQEGSTTQMFVVAIAKTQFWKDLSCTPSTLFIAHYSDPPFPSP
jgi:hypothetical protein